MIKVSIKNQSNVVKFAAKFSTQAEADVWIAQETANQSWGKPDRWVLEESCTADDIASALSSRVVETLNGNLTEYQLPAEYTIETSDVTAEHDLEQLVDKASKSQTLGALIIAKVWSINESKNIDQTTFDALMADQTLQNIERLLWNGSLKTAKALILTLDNTYFTQAEIDAIIAMIDNSGLI